MDEGPDRAHHPSDAGALLKGALRTVARLGVSQAAWLTLAASMAVTVIMLAERLRTASTTVRPFHVGDAYALSGDTEALSRVMGIATIRLLSLSLLYALTVTCLVERRGGESFGRMLLRAANAAVVAGLCTCLAYACLFLPGIVAACTLCLATPIAARHEKSPFDAFAESGGRMYGNKGAYLLFRLAILLVHVVVHAAVKGLWEAGVAARVAPFGYVFLQAAWFGMVAPAFLVHLVLVAGADVFLESETDATGRMQRAHEVFA
jgi:hypothetical protein